MTDYYNTLGSSTITGTAGRDLFYAFTKDPNPDHVRADALLAALAWDTGLLTANGTSFRINAANVQISTDLLLGMEGTDFIYGSSAADALFYNNGMISGGFGGFSNIEQFWMGDGDDIIDLSAHGAGGVDYNKDAAVHGEGGNDTIVGGAGKDTLQGEAGNDLVFGFRGSDTISGGLGNDILYGDDLGYNGVAGDDIIDGDAGNDILYGGGRSDRMTGGDDNDILYGQAGGDNLSGGAGDDLLYGDDADTASNDTLNGGAGNDRLYGGAGDDEVYGGLDEDQLDGGAGNDYLNGGAGADTLFAGVGNDILDGGLDSDTVVFGGNRADYQIAAQADGSFIVSDIRAGSPDGMETVRNVETFAFADITVPSTGLNNPPVITSNGGGAAATLAVNENESAVTIVSATDADAGQTIRYVIVGGADAALFGIDPASGALTFVTPPNFENPADADVDNVYRVIVAADDGNGGVDTQDLSVTVLDVADGFAPVIVSDGGGATALVAVAENTLTVTTVAATDADGPAISYAIGGGADAALFTIDPLTGVVSFLTAPDFENPGDRDHNNIYDLVVVASDGANVDRQTIAVTVGNVNDNAPVLTSYGGGAAAELTVDENSTLAALVSASDADGTSLTYSIAGGTDAAAFTIDPATGQIAFLTAPDYEHPTDSDQDRVYQLVVQSSDGINAVTQTLTIHIANLNDNAPVIISNGGGATASLSIAENGTAVTTVTATDADGGTPSYALSGGADAGLFAIDAVTGALAFLTPPDFEHRIDTDGDGVYQVSVRASDGVNVVDQLLSISITDVNEIGKRIYGTSGNNTISPTTTTLGYQTTALNDTVYALGGNDVIDGGRGADTMDGGSGNDTFYVDTYSDDGYSGNDDQLIEAAGGGVDLAYASVSYRLAAQVENLTLTGADAINGIGNELANVLTGNAAANVLDGGGGNDIVNGGAGMDTLAGGDGDDRLYGGSDADVLSGGIGDDLLDGGTGADVMTGGDGNDTYHVDSWSDSGPPGANDQVIELAGGGVDTVIASVGYRLAAEVEKLVLSGVAAIEGYGNDLANTITGNVAGNALYGGLGNDGLSGGGGDDRLYGEDGVDTLDGGDGADLLAGGALGDTLLGKAGQDLLVGGAGKDMLSGGTDADTFAFTFGDTTLSSASYDRITDFKAVEGDRIDLDFVTGPFPGGSYAETSVSSNNFADALTAAKAFAGVGHVAFVAGATDGWVFWDGNGDGTLDQSVLLVGVNTLSGVDATTFI